LSPEADGQAPAAEKFIQFLAAPEATAVKKNSDTNDRRMRGPRLSASHRRLGTQNGTYEKQLK
jgi:hypothetical protein